jgi:hypothetical protein
LTLESGVPVNTTVATGTVDQEIDGWRRLVLIDHTVAGAGASRAAVRAAFFRDERLASFVTRRRVSQSCASRGTSPRLIAPTSFRYGGASGAEPGLRTARESTAVLAARVD